MPVPFIAARLLIVIGSFFTYLGTGIEVHLRYTQMLYIIYDNALTTALMGIVGYIIAPKKKFICGLIQMITWGLIAVVLMSSAITISLMQGYTNVLVSWDAIKLYIMLIVCFISIIITSRALFQNEKEIHSNSDITVE